MVQTASNVQADELIGRVVEEYFQRMDRGEQPSLDEFVASYPEIGDILRVVIPALQAADQTTDASGTGAVATGRQKQLGDFRILRQIGRGGMGIVYEAEQITMQRRVALKVLPLAGLCDDVMIRRFQNEVRAVAALDHPNIVSVYTVNEERGVHYFAMQLIRGRSLAEVVASLRHVRDRGKGLDDSTMRHISRIGKMKDGAEVDPGASMELVEGDSCDETRPGPMETVAEAGNSTIPHSSSREYFRSVAALGIQAASALQHAHDAGIIHRDIKPANLLLDSSSQLHLTDFGLARIEADAGVTMTGDLIGTLRYMAPEQALAKRVVVDYRADIYSLGATLYELLTLRPAYVADDRQQLLKQIAFEEPTPLRRIDRNIPVELETIVLKAMSKDMDQRYCSAQELADDLRAHLENRPITARPPTWVKTIGKWTRRNPTLTWASVIALSLVALTLAVSTLFIRATEKRLARERWARQHSLPELRRLIDEERFAEALTLALKVERQIPGDPTLEKMWPEFSVETSIRTDPSGVDIAIRRWNATDDMWRPIGTTPIDRIRLPRGVFHWRLSKTGYATLVVRRNEIKNQMTFRLEKSGGLAQGMVRWTTDGKKKSVALFALSHVKRLAVGDFLIDRYEVTNRQFQEFVDRGGYASPRYWKHPFDRGDSTLSWEDAVAEFVDSTGKPGPAGWKSGRYPEGQHAYPVRGVSWFEAAAYAEFAGKRLPSVYHWVRAGEPMWGTEYIVPLSNFGTGAPAPVGQYQGVSACGAFDMAGNVKEWCSNGAGDGRRYILGGAWNDEEYTFNSPDFQSPFARSETFGFRCVRILDGGGTSPSIDDDLIRKKRDFSKEKPVSDEEFAIYKRWFSYDKGPLNQKVLRTRESEAYSYEKVEFDAAYGNERVTAHFYRPSHTAPPYQTVIYFPPAYVIYRTRFDESVLPHEIAFLVENGRAVLYPIYRGTFGRKPKLETVTPAATTLYRSHVIEWSQDLGRSIDYLETRRDVEHEKLAYFGYSWGGKLGAILPAVEKRLKVAVLSGAGFNEQKPLKSVDQINFAPRVTIPVLMLNGRYNTFFPIELAVKPMFEKLGTREADKCLLPFNSGLYIPQKELTKQTIDWLDKYLGPVERPNE